MYITFHPETWQEPPSPVVRNGTNQGQELSETNPLKTQHCFSGVPAPSAQIARKHQTQPRGSLEKNWPVFFKTCQQVGWGVGAKGEDNVGRLLSSNCLSSREPAFVLFTAGFLVPTGYLAQSTCSVSACEYHLGHDVGPLMRSAQDWKLPPGSTRDLRKAPTRFP